MNAFVYFLKSYLNVFSTQQPPENSSMSRRRRKTKLQRRIDARHQKHIRSGAIIISNKPNKKNKFKRSRSKKRKNRKCAFRFTTTGLE